MERVGRNPSEDSTMKNRKLIAKGVWWDVASCPFPDDKFSLSSAQPCIESTLNKYLCPGPVNIYAMVDARKISRYKLEEIASSGILIRHYEHALAAEFHSLLKSWTYDKGPPSYLLTLCNLPLPLSRKHFDTYGHRLILGRTYPHHKTGPGPGEWYWNWNRLLEDEHHDYTRREESRSSSRSKSESFLPPWHCLLCTSSFDNPEEFFSHLSSRRHTEEKKSIEKFIWKDDGGPLDIYNPPPLYKYYKAPSSLLHHSHSGFLITCKHAREGLATKEIITILEKYLGPIHEEKYEVLKSCGMSMPRKQRYLDDEMIEEDEGETVLEALQETGENAMVDESINEEHNTLMSRIKLTDTGLLLFTFPVGSSADPTDIVSRIFESLESGGMKKSPRWCQRIFPVQATCGLTEQQLRETVSRLVQRYKNNSPLRQPVKFAVRCVEDTKGTEAVYRCPLLERSKCLETVAAGVKDIVPDAVVDLKSPELCVLLELLPLFGIPKGSFVAAVSVLPPRFVTERILAM